LANPVFRQHRLKLIEQALGEREIVLVIDDTGDRKKHTDYVKRQYIGNLGKIENGIVAVTAYGLINNITVPLLFEVYKPKERLKPEDSYQQTRDCSRNDARPQSNGISVQLSIG